MLKSLGAAVVFDYKSTHIVQEIRLSSPHGAGVEAIIDAVGSVATNSMLLQTLIHPKLFAEVVTEQMAGSIPADVKHTLVFGRKAMAGLGGTHLFATLGELLASKEYRLPLPVRVVGVGLGAIEHGLQKLKTGVSGTKLVVTV
jgi:threonine dehydrogenase-like Zn-dependent dehydrogenase